MPFKVLIYSRFPKAMMVRIGERFELLDAGGKPPGEVFTAEHLSGIRAMRKPPALLIVVDPGREHIAVAEAKKLGIPVMALVDTNCDPDPIDYVIACNDDALKSIKLILQALTQAVIDRKNELNILGVKGEKEEGIEGETDVEEEGEEESEGGETE